MKTLKQFLHENGGETPVDRHIAQLRAKGKLNAEDRAVMKDLRIMKSRQLAREANPNRKETLVSALRDRHARSR